MKSPTTPISSRSENWLEHHAVTIYRHRDPETGKLSDHWTVVNEDAKARRGGVAQTLEAAINDAAKDS